MSHMVIYRGNDGKPGYHQTDEIVDAVGFVERLRNEQSVEHARIFRLEEVQFEFRPYYRVELTSSAGSLQQGPQDRTIAAPQEREQAPAAAPAPAFEPGQQHEPAQVPGAVSVAGDDSLDNGVGARRGLFGR